jgi:hypothetical protein
MKKQDIVRLYEKEREYQIDVFGDYKKITTLSFPSFLIFLEVYLDKAKKAYAGKWTKNLPAWLISCAEGNDGTAPVKAYEEVVKIMALAGAALETYAEIDPEKWRETAEIDRLKWEEGESE